MSGDGAIIRGKRQGFTVLYNSVVQDKALRLETIGLFAKMASLPDDWEYSISGLAHICSSDSKKVGREKVRSMLVELEKAGYLLREQGHDSGGKFTSNVYVFQEQKPENVTVDGFAVSGENRQRQKPLTAEPPEYNKYNNKINIPPIPPTGERPDDMKKRKHDTADMELFDRFWLLYPKKRAKQDAARAWKRLAPDKKLCMEMSRALKSQMQSEDWQREDGRFVPYPATWLRQKRWEDADVQTTTEPPAPERRVMRTELVDGEEVDVFGES